MSQPLGPDWKVVTLLWKGEDAKFYLSKAPPRGLPKRGPLFKLLDSTATLLLSVPEPSYYNATVACQAVRSGGFSALLQVVNWLQRRPCYELHIEPWSATYWGQFTMILSQMLSALEPLTGSSTPTDKVICTCCMEQLMQTPGGHWLLVDSVQAMSDPEHLAVTIANMAFCKGTWRPCWRLL